VRHHGGTEDPGGEVLSRYDLIEGAWDMAYENKSNVIDVYIRYLRNKIDRPFGMRTIETVRGAGYRLAAAARLRSRQRDTGVRAALWQVTDGRRTAVREPASHVCVICQPTWTLPHR
jgi:DNA-binding winged helix-turn-helix (wHTH) protein